MVEYSVIYMFQILIHSSFSGHLGCFHVLAIVNNAAMNIGVHVSFWITVLSGYMPQSGIAGSYDNSVFSFLENFHAVFHRVVPIYIPTNSIGGRPFSTLSPSFVICRLVNDGQSDQCEGVPHCSFDLHLSTN